MARTYKRDSRGRFAGGGGGSRGGGGGGGSRKKSSTTARQNPTPAQRAAATRRANIARAKKINRRIRQVQVGILVAATAAPSIISATNNIAGAANYARAARRTAKMNRPIRVKATRVR